MQANSDSSYIVRGRVVVYFDHDGSAYTAGVVRELTERLEKEGASAVSASATRP